MYEELWDEARAQVTVRARIDLSCSDLHAELVSKQGRYPVEISVQGCGRTALYHRALRRHFGKYTTKNTVWEAVAVSQPPSPAPSQPVAAQPLSTGDNLPPQPY